MSTATIPTIQLPSDADASGRSFGDEERALLHEVLESGVLNCTRGTQVRELEKELAEWLGVQHCRAVASGTAAVHTAVAAVDPAPGDEIVTTPITDMGAITPILYQAALPVFADVDLETYNVTADTIEKRLTRRTRAVIVTHLFGGACDMDPIVELCRARGIPVIEDCAQAYGAVYRGRRVGTLGDIGCFSLQQGKHVSSGEGGLVVTDDPELHRRMVLFSDKAWGYGDEHPDHYFLALNYRMTELAGAVARAQLAKLPAMLEQRVAMAERLRSGIAGVPGVSPPAVVDGARHVYWKFPLRVASAVVDGGALALGARLKEAGVWCAPRYVQKPAFECQVLRDQVTFGGSRFPFEGPQRDGEPPVVYDREQTPGAIEALERVVVLPINERYRPEHVDFVAERIDAVARELAR